MDALRFSLIVVFAFNAGLTIYSNLVSPERGPTGKKRK
jgi:hypothetical protein